LRRCPPPHTVAYVPPLPAPCTLLSSSFVGPYMVLFAVQYSTHHPDFQPHPDRPPGFPFGKSTPFFVRFTKSSSIPFQIDGREETDIKGSARRQQGYRVSCVYATANTSIVVKTANTVKKVFVLINLSQEGHHCHDIQGHSLSLQQRALLHSRLANRAQQRPITTHDRSALIQASHSTPPQVTQEDTGAL
jgi:hypothetical protein